MRAFFSVGFNGHLKNITPEKFEPYMTDELGVGVDLLNKGGEQDGVGVRMLHMHTLLQHSDNKTQTEYNKNKTSG